MKYYKVIRDIEQQYKFKFFKTKNFYEYRNSTGKFWEKDILYTETELNRISDKNILVDKNLFEIIYIPKAKTYKENGLRKYEIESEVLK